jgi:hypothetical protein
MLAAQRGEEALSHKVSLIRGWLVLQKKHCNNRKLLLSDAAVAAMRAAFPKQKSNWRVTDTCACAWST